MPARKIPMNYRYLTGIVASTMTAFEATLERDFYILLGADPRVAKVDEQPLKLTYQDDQGVTRPYTPDALVTYRPDPATGHTPQPHLYEVKPREKIRAEWPDIKRKYKLARRFARLQGWRFGFITEKEIRGPYLDNVKFLRRYRRGPADPKDRELLIATLRKLKDPTPGALLGAATPDPQRRVVLTSSLWKLVAAGDIGCDLEQPLTMRSPIYFPSRTEG